jgi:hypothetical protein
MSTKTKTSRNNPTWLATYESGFGDGESISASPVVVQAVSVTNKGASALYFQLFDLATAAGAGAVPVTMPIAVPAGSTVSVDYNAVSGAGFFGFATAAGLAWAASTTAGTLTADSTSSLWTSIRYS